MLRRARYWCGKSSIRLAVCLSVTLGHRGHIGWNTSKIILWQIGIGFLLSADPTITDLLDREHPEMLAGMGLGYEKVAFGVQKLKISETQQDRTKVTIEDPLSIGAKINDLGWP